MTVETATYINGLNATYPLSTDPKSEGDNHIRLLKSTLKATFPNITEAVTVTAAQLNASNVRHLKSFGAVGNGTTDDTTAVRTAIQSGFPLDWGNGTYKITSAIIETVAEVNWVGDGATIIYDGAYAKDNVVITCGIGADHFVSGITFDANEKTHVAIRFIAATVSEAIDQWPNFYGSHIVAKNSYRKTTTFADGDGIIINGGFNKATLEHVKVHDCYMAAGAAVAGSQGIFGITFGSNGSRRCRNIRLSDYHVENIWSEDGAIKSDQDAIRVFQETDERTSSCYILNGVVKNVSNRAIKLHSGVNTVVDGLYRELSDSAIPQSGEFSNPDIDSQQCPSTITNCRFHYDGAWHATLVLNYTERTGLFRYGGAVVSNITGKFANVTGSAITAVYSTLESGVSDTREIASVSNIAIDGPLDCFLHVKVTGSGLNSATLSNATATVSGAAVRTSAASGGTPVLRVTASNIQNFNFSTPVPLGDGFTTAADSQLFVSGAYGFTAIGATSSIGCASPVPYKTGVSVIGSPITSTAISSDTDTLVLLAPVADSVIHVAGNFVMMRGTAISAMGGVAKVLIQKDATGDAAGTLTFECTSPKVAALVTCTFDGVSRIAIRFSGGASGSVLAQGYFSGNYVGSAPMKIVPASAVSSIAALVQRSGFEPSTTFAHPVRITSYTVASLPLAASFVRCKAFVTDANSTTFGSVVAGGGVNTVPVYCDGTSWRIG